MQILFTEHFALQSNCDNFSLWRESAQPMLPSKTLCLCCDQKVLLVNSRLFCFQVSDSLLFDTSDEEELREQLDMHSIIVSCVHEEPLFTADQVQGRDSSTEGKGNLG